MFMCLPHWVPLGPKLQTAMTNGPINRGKVYTLIVVVLMVIFALAFMYALNKARFCFFSEKNDE